MDSALAMILLEPAAAGIAGALAGAGLLALYFLRLRRRPVRVTSTLFWTTSTSDLQVNVPLRWIRASWLLLLQILILGLLAVAIGRPAVGGGDFTARPTLILIDRSASMAAPVHAGGPTRLEEARSRAVEVLQGLPGGAPAQIVSVASATVAVTSMTRDRGLLRQAIQAIAPTDEPGSLSRAFELVRAIAGQSGEGDESPPPRIILLSDGSFEDSASAGGIGRGTLEYIRIGGADAPDNVGIVSLAARRDYEDPAMVRLFVRVQSIVGRELSVPIECRIEDKVIASVVVPVGAGSPVEPADAARTIEFQNAEGGLVTVRLDRRDDLSADDEAGLVLRSPSALRLALVRPNIAADALDEVVRAALESLAPASLAVLNAGEYERLLQRGGVEADLIVFDRVRPSTLPAVPSISFGATVPIPGLGVAPGTEQDPVKPTALIFWQRSHPVMRYVVLNNVWVASPMRVTLPDESPPRASGGRTKSDTLATGDEGPLIVSVETGDTRRIIVGFDLGESNWVKDASFHIFLKNAVDYLTLSGEDEAGRALRTTETFSVRPLPGISTVEVEGPVSLSRATGGAGEGGRLSLGPFPLVGVYRIRGVLAEDSVAAVNLLDPGESRLEVRDVVQAAGGSIQAVGTAADMSREVWHWFVLGALVLLGVEWLLYAWRMRV